MVNTPNKVETRGKEARNNRALFGFIACAVEIRAKMDHHIPNASPRRVERFHVQRNRFNYREIVA